MQWHFISPFVQKVEPNSCWYLVCERKGVKSRSEEYLSNLVETNTTMKSLDFYLILKAAGQIETLLQLGDMVSFGPRK